MATKAKRLDKYSELQDILSKELPLHAARIKCMVLLITALIKVQNVNFERLAEGFAQPVSLASNLRRIQRFFARFILETDLIARLLFKMLPLKGPYGLSLDRTNWKFGQQNINILVLGIIYKGVAFPILWSFLGNKRGNSSQEERIALLQKFINLFGAENIDFLSADREFVGQEWWQFLIVKKIRFFIRMRENMQVYVPKKGFVKAFWLFNRLGLRVSYQYPKMVRIADNWVYLSGMKYVAQDGKTAFLLVASGQQEAKALEYYGQRWQIETMFKAFKTAGFHLENTHLRQDERLNKLLLLTAIAFIWAYKAGIYLHRHRKALKIKKHGRLEKSYFAYGLKTLAFVLINMFENQMNTLINAFLSCT